MTRKEWREEFKKWSTEAVCLKAVEQNGYSLQYVKDQTEAVCLKAVVQDGDSLQYVKDQAIFEKLLVKIVKE